VLEDLASSEQMRSVRTLGSF